MATVDSQDLVISRLVRAPRAKLWKAWTDPHLLKEWWCPKPWTTEVRAFELRPGGAFYTFMMSTHRPAAPITTTNRGT